MSERSCPNTVPCLTNMPKKNIKKQPYSNIYASAWYG